ncbi:MAG: hypothetical protein VB949_02220 [Pseudomonadales bacterium]|jgi:hypothetical protein
MDANDEQHFPASMKLRPAARYIALGVVAVLLVAGHQFVALPGNLIGRTLQNALHIPAFAGLGLTLAWCFPKWSMRLLIGCCLLVGIGLEAL